MNELKIYEVLEESRDDPDKGPNKPPEQGDWTWWRTGPHPMGVWQAMDWKQPEWGPAYQANREEFPIVQDEAHGEPSDFGWYACHACGYSGEGYPEAGHKTECDGVCKRNACPVHPDKIEVDDEDGPRLTVTLTAREWDWLGAKLEEPPVDLPRLRKLFEGYRHD